jgi:hypothetical protein
MNMMNFFTNTNLDHPVILGQPVDPESRFALVPNTADRKLSGPPYRCAKART